MRQDAPLYVRAHDLTVSLHRMVSSWPEPHRQGVGVPLLREVSALLCGISLALAFPLRRALHIRRSDESLLRLRVLLRVASGLGLLAENPARTLHDELTDMGRMLGGWKKRETRRLSAMKEADLKRNPEHTIEVQALGGGGSPERPGA